MLEKQSACIIINCGLIRKKTGWEVEEDGEGVGWGGLVVVGGRIRGGWWVVVRASMQIQCACSKINSDPATCYAMKCVDSFDSFFPSVASNEEEEEKEEAKKKGEEEEEEEEEE